MVRKVGKKHLEQAIADLYRQSPEHFVARRKALVSELTSSGEEEAAARVGRLEKPVLSAWAVNRLWWTSRKRFDRLIAVSQELRSIQQGGGGDLDAVRRQRRDLLEQLVGESTRLAAGAGQPLSRALQRRVETTLEAVATFGNAGPDQQLGHLVRDLEPPGFEALMNASNGPRSRPGSGKSEVERRLRQARTELREVERRVKRGTKEIERATTAYGSAANEARLRAREAESARRKLAAAETRARKAHAKQEQADQRRQLCREGLQRSEEARDAIRKRIADLEGRGGSC